MSTAVKKGEEEKAPSSTEKSVTAWGEPRNLTEETYEHMLDLILSRKLPGGTIIQERRMAEDLGVSRTPMREAIGRLEGEGLVVRHNARLLAVRHVSLDEYLQSLEVRLLVEPYAANIAAEHIPTERLAELRRSLRSIDPSHTFSPAQHWVFDDNLHGAIGEYCENGLIAKTIQGMRRFTKMFERQSLAERNAPGWAEHESILSALETRDGALASKAMTRHLRTARKTVLDSFVTRTHMQ
ncbi:GntR family transcriptional regulator [Komagataeibacter xylinus]|uniref:GntR family transcriptional regulator n=1 Tax=Komagataeibacter xylinus TaxID=28448 RepID=A0A318PHJ2_KOMXY|nr:GntR family transcriptional regulator [Komagataeibacter xylinus]PYD56738.1 GntR family transcriptional regulator [Komagataeibacter xylinus]GBQ74079.1 transcriptional regulator [Komagataeibacter xylinus NBRC 15237]